MVPDLQEKLLFAKQSVSQSDKRREHSSQPYLLALLTHQSSWSTLHRCINSLLSSCDKGLVLCNLHIHLMKFISSDFLPSKLFIFLFGCRIIIYFNFSVFAKSLLICWLCICSYDHVSVLDFLWACIHIPKIWQGRERKLPKVCLSTFYVYLRR